MFSAGAVYILFKEEVELPAQTSATPVIAPFIPTPYPSLEAKAEEEAVPPSAGNETEEQAPEQIPVQGKPLSEGSEEKERHVVLRLLTGDERTVFRSIMDAGGEMYQKDIVTKTNMTDAKVSRVLDRLAEKGVVSKERHGMSNKVRIEIEE